MVSIDARSAPQTPSCSRLPYVACVSAVEEECEVVLLHGVVLTLVRSNTVARGTTRHHDVDLELVAVQETMDAWCRFLSSGPTGDPADDPADDTDGK